MKNQRSSSFDLVAPRSRTYKPRPIVYSNNRVFDVSTRTDFKSTNKPNIKNSNSVPRVNVQKIIEPNPVHESFNKTKVTKKPKNRNIFINRFIMGMAVIVFVVGIGVSVQSFKVNKKISEKVSAQNNVQSSDEISEDEPSDEEKRSYSVSPDHPRMIYIPSINVNSRVKQVGVNAEGQLDVPGNVFDTAWYKESAIPGTLGGSTVIDGHVSGPTQKGAFYNLKNVKDGDKITIEKGNGNKINYKVKKVEIVETSKVDMANILVPLTPGSHGLNLISCTGKYNEQSKDFEQRVLVFAKID